MDSSVGTSSIVLPQSSLATSPSMLATLGVSMNLQTWAGLLHADIFEEVAQECVLTAETKIEAAQDVLDRERKLPAQSEA